MRKRRGPKDHTIDEAPKLRSVAARSRGRKFGIDVRMQAFQFRQGMQASLLLIRLKTDSQSIEKELAQFDRLSAFQANRFAREPIGYDYLSSLTTPKPISLSQEISWLGKRLSRQAESVKNFINEKILIEKCIFRDYSQKSLEKIERLEEQEGVSLWSVMLTVSILQWFYGTEEQKNFVARIKQLNKAAMLPYVTNYVSQLCEETVTLSWYRQNLQRRLTGREITDISVYMQSKLGARWPPDDDEIAVRLRIEQNHHHFDVYESLIGAIQTLLMRPDLSESLKGAILNACDALDDVCDIRLSKIKARLRDEKISLPFDPPSRSLELLLMGESVMAAKNAVASLKESPNSIYDVIAFAAAEVPMGRRFASIDSGLAKAVAEGLRPVLSRNLHSSVRHDQLEKLCVMFQGLPYASALHEFIRAEHTNDPGEYFLSLQAFATASSNLSAIDLALVNRKSIQIESPIINTLDAMQLGECVNDATVSDDLLRFGRYFHSATIGNGTEAVKAVSLLTSRNSWIRAHAALVALRGYTLIGDVDGAAKIISNQVCIHGAPPDILPIEEIFKGLIWKDLQPHTSTIQFMNAFHLYVEQTTDDAAATHRRFALASFLKSISIELPSQIRSSVTNYDWKELRFFLGKVCVSHSIDMLRNLKSSAEVLEERRSICSVILSATREGMAEYEDEVVSITKELAVQQGLRAYDGSRIHVDMAGLKKVLRKHLSESYARYTALVASGIGVGDDYDDLLRELIRNEGDAKDLLVIPKNEADELLHAIMAEIRDGFLFNIPHGLDSYLSKRVRHGSIVGHIRGAVEQENVVLQKDSTQSYVSDGVLTSGLPAPEAEEINAAMVSFSKAFDNYIVRLKEVILHVRSAERPLGIFDLSYNANALSLIRSSYKTDATFDGLLDSVLVVFWALIKPSLSHAQQLLRLDASKALTDQLNLLRHKVQEVVTDSVERGRIGGAISRAITNVQAKLEVAAGWFDPAHLEAREFTAEEAVNIGVAAVRSIHFGFDPNVEILTENSPAIETTYLPIFVDILFIIFGNIAEYANCGSNPLCVVRVSRSGINGILKVQVENEVSLKEPLEICMARISDRRDRVATGELSARVRQEGGSGLAKLSSIVSQSARGRLNFGYRDEKTFFVEMELSLVGDEAADTAEHA